MYKEGYANCDVPVSATNRSVTNDLEHINRLLDNMEYAVETIISKFQGSPNCIPVKECQDKLVAKEPNIADRLEQIVKKSDNLRDKLDLINSWI